MVAVIFKDKREGTSDLVSCKFVRTNSGSNYADETPTGLKGLKLPIFDDQPAGPFWIKPEASPDYTDPSDYILTKVREKRTFKF